MDGCVEVDVVVELPLGVVSRVDPGIGILGGDGRAPSGRVVLGVSSRVLDWKSVGGRLQCRLCLKSIRLLEKIGSLHFDDCDYR